MSISWSSVTGFPIPVGATFRQRQIMAKDPMRYSSPDNRPIPWAVSVVDTLRGPMVEMHRAHCATSIVATDLPRHTLWHDDDVLALTSVVLDDTDGWKSCVAKACIVGCGRAVPMHATHWRNGSGECVQCSTRTLEACPECGAPDELHYIGREKLLADGLCFHCNHWASRIAKPPEVITPTFEVYGIGKGTGPASCKGFGGRKFVVAFFDGRVVNTDDLWSGGQIPEWFHDRFTPNADVVSAPIKVGLLP